MKKKQGKRQFLAAFLAIAMAFTSLNFGPVGAATAYAAEESAALQDGDYYIMNTATGKYLNGGGSWGTHASVLPFGQLMTVKAVQGGLYTIQTHLDNNKVPGYLGTNGFVDNGTAAQLTITIQEDGSFTIAKDDGQYLTAETSNEMANFMAEATEYSIWRFLTREQLIEDAVMTAAGGTAVDVSSLIFDAGFPQHSAYLNKWNITPTRGGASNGNSGNYCAEVYHKTFDSRQVLENVPNGVYELNVQGFYREDSADQAATVYYANDTEHALKKIEDEAKTERIEGSWAFERPQGSGIFVPNSMGEAANCFVTDASYTNEPIQVTVTDGTLAVGIRTAATATWNIWDNFSLKLLSVADSELSNRAIAKIDAIGEVTLTDACKAKIDAAKAAYDALTDAQKELVPAEKLKVLTDAEASYAQMVTDKAAADDAVAKINAIGKIQLTDGCKAKLADAKTAFDALTDAQKALVPAEITQKLTDAQEQFQALVPAAPVFANGDYYIINAATGRLLNGGNSWGTQASALTYGQLVTLASVNDTYHYTLDSHYSNGGNNHYLATNGFLDGGAAPLLIAPCGNGAYTISHADNQYLTASTENTVLTFGRKTELSEWRILTRQEYIDEAVMAVSDTNPVDVTSLILDSGITRNNQYYSNWKTTGKGVVKYNPSSYENNNLERYCDVFSFYQTIENIPNGVYELSVQGFCRRDKGTETDALPVFYANENEQALMDITVDGRPTQQGGWTTQRGDVFVPNSMSDSAKCFTANAYQNEPLRVEVTNHTLTVGVKAVNGNCWVMWDAFTLKLISAADSEYTDLAIAKIDAIGTVALTDACKAKIDAARAAYNALTDTQKQLITAEKLKVLTDAEAAYADLVAADKTEKLIDAIGTVVLNKTCDDKIKAARASYNALTDAQKALVKNTAVLEKAETDYAALLAEQGQEGFDRNTANEAAALIQAIGEVQLTDACKAKIDAARAAYNALTDAQKAYITKEDLDTLTAAEATYDALEKAANQAAADAAIAKIGAIGTVAYTAESRIAIKAARIAYNALTADQKALVTNYGVLEQAEADYAALFGAADPVLANGDYYIVNAATGKYLNAGNEGQTQASAQTYGQLMTFAANADDKSEYTVDSHYASTNTNHYLGADGILDSKAEFLTIEKCASGNFTIANAADKFLAAQAEGTVVSFQDGLSAASEWLILSRAQLIERLSKDGTDLTTLIFDPKFDIYNSYFSQWGGAAKGGDASNNCAEAYQKTFDYTQTLTGVPNGVYELTLQGFYRTKDTEPGPEYYMNNDSKPLMTIEADAKTESTPGWGTERGDVYVPNSMSDASKCFTAGAYTNEALRTTVTNHTLKLGIRWPNAKNNTMDWVIWDNFSLKLIELNSDEQIAADAAKLIDAIGTVAYTPECKAKIDAARAAYNALTDDQKAYITAENLKVLTDAEAEYQRLLDEAMITDAINKIDAIGTVAYTPECKAKIDAARSAYNALTDAQKSSVTAEKVKVLTDAEAEYQRLYDAAKITADKEAANAAVAKIDAIGTVANTADSKAKIDAARAAYNALTNDQKGYVADAKVKVLTDAEAKYQQLVADAKTAADKKAANAVIDKIDAIGVVAYTSDCKAKIDAAKAAYNALTDDQKKYVGNKLTVLTGAETEYNRLKDYLTPSAELKTTLANTIAAADAASIDESAYTAASIQNYKDALAAMKALANKQDATKSEIESAIAVFNSAKNGLTMKVDSKPTLWQQAELATMITAGTGLNADDYIKDANWTAFQKAIEDAQAVKDNPLASNAQFQKAIDDLAAAKAKLTPVKPIVDKTALNQAIAACGELSSSAYTSATWKEFQAALDAAKAVSAQEDAAQADVDSALETLNAKKDALVAVVKVTKVALSASSKKIAAGKKVTVKAKLTPSNPTNKKLTWKSSNTKYATVTQKGVVTTKKAGAGKTVTIRATAKDGSKKYGTIKIKIMKHLVKKISLQAPANVKAGKKATIKATVKTSGKSVNKTLAWTSSNKKYATVSSKGVVTAKAAGAGKTVTITAKSTDGTNKKATVKIKITK